MAPRSSPPARRRHLLFVLSLFTLILVFAGAVPFAPWLAERPLAFALFWAIAFLLVAAMFGLALFDLWRVRRDHRHHVRDLAKELEEIAAEARDEMDRRRGGGDS